MLAAVLAVLALQEEPVTVALVFEKMHCEECRLEIEASVKRWTGFKSLAVAENVVTATLEEKAPVPPVAGFPKDLVLSAARITLRGVVSASGEKLTLVAKGSGAVLALGADPVLKKALGGKNRFRLTGVLGGPKLLKVETFAAVDWKE